MFAFFFQALLALLLDALIEEEVMIRHRPNKSGPAPLGCPLESSLKLLAGEWTLKILWYLRTEPRRFGDLKRDLGHISAKVLTTRLRELEKRGVLTREVMPTSPPTVEYELTELGKSLEPILEAIAEVGKKLTKMEGEGVSAKTPQ
ncbi:MAG TPA: helix-turn-helix domain-containing protein, partial [bacterium]